jgi:Domain of unknown function (DUF4397)
MTRTIRPVTLIVSLALLIAGCAESDRETATGKAQIRGFNAIAEAPGITFKIEERSLGSVAFGDSSPIQRYDDLSYNFNFDLLPLGSEDTQRLASQFVDVIKDTQYLFVLSGSLASPQMAVWSRDERAWAGTETVLQLDFLHAGSNVGAVDVYLAAPGVAPAAGNALGTLRFGERLPVAEYAAGQYVLTLTTVNDPQDVLFVSPTRTLAGATTDTIIILDSNPSRTADIFVRQLTGNGSVVDISDARFPPVARFLHAAIAVGNVDIAENDDFGNLLLGNQPYGDLSAEISLTAGNTDYTWTAAGNPGAIVLESTETIPAGFYTTLALVGKAADHDVMNIINTRRPVSTHGQISFVQAAANFNSVDIYFLTPGQAVADVNAASPNVPFKFTTGMTAVRANDYRVAVTAQGSKTVVAGPLDVPIANGDVVEVYLLDTVDPNTVSILVNRIAP